MQEKEYFYLGHYYLPNGEYVLKIGTTDNLDRRQKEHRRNYKTEFEYDWFIPLSKYNTLRVEDNTRESFIACGFGEFMRNDRFVFAEKPSRVFIGVKKVYEVTL